MCRCRRSLLPSLAADLSGVASHSCAALIAIFRGSVNVIGQLLIWTSLFCTIGVQLFGGTVYATNPALAGTTYQESYYEVSAWHEHWP